MMSPNNNSKQTNESTVGNSSYNLEFFQLESINIKIHISVTYLILGSSVFLAYKVYSNFFSLDSSRSIKSTVIPRSKGYISKKIFIEKLQLLLAKYILL